MPSTWDISGCIKHNLQVRVHRPVGGTRLLTDHYNNSNSLVTKSCPTLATPLTVAYQAPLSMGFSRQEYWSGLPFPSPGDPPDPGIEPRSPALKADALLSEPPGKSPIIITQYKNWYKRDINRIQ